MVKDRVALETERMVQEYHLVTTACHLWILQLLMKVLFQLLTITMALFLVLYQAEKTLKTTMEAFRRLQAPLA